MELFIDKITDLMRSTLVAIGLAELLYHLPPISASDEVRIRDMGSCYKVTSGFSVEELTQFVANKGYLYPLLPAIRKPYSAKEQQLIEGGVPEEEIKAKYVPRQFKGDEIDYGYEKNIADDAKKLSRKQKGAREEGDIPRPKPNFPVWAHLCSYFGKGSAMRVGYPSVLHTWHAHENEAAVELWKLIVDCYGTFPNPVTAARDFWDTEFRRQLDYEDFTLTTEVSSLALVSPSTSKGASDAAAYNMLTEDTPNTFWLEIYFAFAGFLAVGMPFTIGSDVVTYYPLPKDVSHDALHDIMKQYRESDSAYSLYRYSNQMNRAKLDILNHIIYYRNMTEHFIEGINDGSMPQDEALDAISGLVGYFYKDISSQIPFDETVFALPLWLQSSASINSLDTASRMLNEHQTLIYAVRGKPPKYQLTADELRVLDHYRRYITHGEPLDWVRFAIAYSLYRFRVLPEMPKFPALSLQVLKESLPSMTQLNDKADFSIILEDPGVQKIAQAINACTSYARWKKDVKQDRTYPFKVRHGLGDDLLRNAHSPDRFLEDLSRFIHDYRRESINVQADTGQYRATIEPEDLLAVTKLVAEYGSNIVAHLLVAAGYASHFGANQPNE